MSHAPGAYALSLGGFEIVLKGLCRGSREVENLAMAQFQTRSARGLDKVDPVWARIRREAEDVARTEPELATFIYSTVLHHGSLEGAIVYRLAERLDHAALSGELI